MKSMFKILLLVLAVCVFGCSEDKPSNEDCNEDCDCPDGEACVDDACVPDTIPPAFTLDPPPGEYLTAIEIQLNVSEPVSVEYEVISSLGGEPVTGEAYMACPVLVPIVLHTMNQGAGQEEVSITFTLTDRAGLASEEFTGTWVMDLTPRVTSIEPASGRPGDTIVVRGHNFTHHPQHFVTVAFDGEDLGHAPCYFTEGLDGELKVTVPGHVRKGEMEIRGTFSAGGFIFPMEETVDVKFVVSGPAPSSGTLFLGSGATYTYRHELTQVGPLQWEVTLPLTKGEVFGYLYYDDWAEEYSPDSVPMFYQLWMPYSRDFVVPPDAESTLTVHDSIYGWEGEQQAYPGGIDLMITDESTGEPLLQAWARAGGRTGVANHEGLIELRNIAVGTHTLTVTGPDDTWERLSIDIEATETPGAVPPVAVELSQPPLVTFTLQARMPAIEDTPLVPLLNTNLANLPGSFDGTSYPFMDPVADDLYEKTVQIPAGHTLLYNYSLGMALENGCDSSPVDHRLLVTADLEGTVIRDEVASYATFNAKPEEVRIARIRATVPINTPPEYVIHLNGTPMLQTGPNTWALNIPYGHESFAFSSGYQGYGVGEECVGYPDCHTAFEVPVGSTVEDYEFSFSKWRWMPEAPLTYPAVGDDIEVDFWITIPSNTPDETLYLYGDAAALGGGASADAVALTPYNEHTYTATVILPAGQEVEFHVSRGTFDSRGLPRGWVEPLFDGQRVQHAVSRWADLPPDFPARSQTFRTVFLNDFHSLRQPFLDMVDHIATKGYDSIAFLGPYGNDNLVDSDFPFWAERIRQRELATIGQGYLHDGSYLGGYQSPLTTEQWNDAFGRHRRHLMNQAALLQQEGGEWLWIHYHSLLYIDGAPVTDAAEQWQQLISDLKSQFSIKLLCTGGGMYRGLGNDPNLDVRPPAPFAQYCDALHVYFDVRLGDDASISVAEMVQVAGQLIADHLQPVRDSLGKPLLLILFYCAHENLQCDWFFHDDYAPWCPEKWNCADPATLNPVSLQDQADVYEAVLRAAAESTAVDGVAAWGYWPLGHVPDNGFPSIRDKLAEEVFMKYGLSAFLVDTDGDGMDDRWEERRGLNVGTNDSAADDDMNGITALEEYLLSW